MHVAYAIVVKLSSNSIVVSNNKRKNILNTSGCTSLILIGSFLSFHGPVKRL